MLDRNKKRVTLYVENSYEVIKRDLKHRKQNKHLITSCGKKDENYAFHHNVLNSLIYLYIRVQKNEISCIFFLRKNQVHL
ncbi:hypothetical protein HNR78_002722 [Parageobacillus toebii NBRC 107807]|uniref:Uncharacterized protein n=1 Tax=Parageobacillus toebii NBRC 107807 TaxID=1223503 RepID=A0AA89NL74_9BACL|nr:hypothetical protein [Parageobacillus toebii NBRC 107807]